jgi:hypothetical protein
VGRDGRNPTLPTCEIEEVLFHLNRWSARKPLFGLLKAALAHPSGAADHELHKRGLSGGQHSKEFLWRGGVETKDAYH